MHRPHPNGALGCGTAQFLLRSVRRDVIYASARQRRREMPYALEAYPHAERPP